MSDATNNGGPAFPCLDSTGAGLCLREPGMTLRDYFAAKAMASCVAAFHEAIRDEADLALVAGVSYQIADAMLKAREVTK